MYNQLQAGFLTCVLPRSSFPSGSSFTGQWNNASRISDLLIGAGAHSGATAADFNRVPVCSIPKQNAPGPAIEISPFQRTNNIPTKPSNTGQAKKMRNNK